MAAPSNSTSQPPRPAYSDWQRQMVQEQYHLCVTRADKVALQKRLGLSSLEQLYNLANRLGVTRSHQERLARAGGHLEGPAFARERLLLREDPESCRFSAEQDDYLRRHFGPEARTRRHLEEIAFHIEHTEAACLYRARHLGLRRFCKYWPAPKMVAWLGLAEERLRQMGVDFYPCINREGQVAITLVSTSSLMRLLGSPIAPDRPEGEEEPAPSDDGLIDQRQTLLAAGADRFILAELAELRAAIAAGEEPFERSRWVSHGHTCLNPFAGLSFGLFDDGSDHKIPGRGLHPSDLDPRILNEH